MKIIGLVLLGIALIYVLTLNKKKLQSHVEKLSIFWFRLAFAFLVLFTMNVLGGFVGIYVPVNIISGLVLTFLGIPGFASIFALALLL